MRHVRHIVLVGEPVFGGVLTGDQCFPFLWGEAGQAEIEAGVLQFGQFDAEQVVIPGGVLADLVVGQDQRAALRVAQVIQRDDRHLGHAQLTSRQQTTVSGDHIVVAIDQDRRAPAEFANAGGDLCDLGLRMLLGIAGIGNQRIDRSVVELQCAHRVLKMKKPAMSRPHGRVDGVGQPCRHAACSG